jgi:DNA repair exonuclease SbcCD ATPase subunit
MVAAFSVAGTAIAALSSADSVLGIKDTTSVPTSSRHWSFYAVSVATAVGVVTGIATAILGNFIATGVAVAMTLSCGFAAYQIRNFGFYKTLEGYVEKLAMRVQSFKDMVSGLRHERESLNQATADFQRVTEAYKREVATQIAQLKTQLAEATALGTTLTQTNTDLQASISTLEASKETLEGERDALTRSVDQLTTERSALSALVTNLHGSNATLQAVASKAAAAGLKLDEENEELKGHNAETARLLEALGTLAGDHTRASHVTASTGRLDGAVGALRAANQELVSSTDHAEAVLDRLERLVNSKAMVDLSAAAALAMAPTALSATVVHTS